MLYNFELSHNSTRVTKNIYYAKGESVFYHSRVTRRLKKYHLGGKNLNNQTKLGRRTSVDSEAVLQVILKSIE